MCPSGYVKKKLKSISFSPRCQNSVLTPYPLSAHQRGQNRYNIDGERDRSSIYRRLNYESVSSSRVNPYGTVEKTLWQG
jgi:hypothetical protein